MNARHELPVLFDAADDMPDADPTEEEQREFHEWAALVHAEHVLREAVESGDALAIAYVKALARYAEARQPGIRPTREELKRNRLAEGGPPI